MRKKSFTVPKLNGKTIFEIIKDETSKLFVVFILNMKMNAKTMGKKLL